MEISDISRALIEIAWYFGPKGSNGECCEDLTIQEFLALVKIFNTRDCPVHEVSKALGFTKSGATRIVNRLESRGYLRKKAQDNDARVCCVSVTLKGESIIAESDTHFKSKYHEVSSRLSPDIQANAGEILIKIAAALKE